MIGELPDRVEISDIIRNYYDQDAINRLMVEAIGAKSPSGLRNVLRAGANPRLQPLIHHPLPIIMVCASDASVSERLQMYSMLIDAGAAADGKNLNGKTCLYLESGHAEVMQFFLDQGVGDVFTIQEFRGLPIQDLNSTLVLQEEDYMQGEDTTTFPCKCVDCGHIFNGPFLHTWLNTNIPGYATLQHSCPMYRSDIKSIEILSKASVDAIQPDEAAEARFKQFVMRDF